MDILKGQIVNTWSEPTSGAPVVVEIASEDGRDSVTIQREHWNDFFYAHQSRVQAKDFRVEVFGDAWNQQILCCDPTCSRCEAVREGLQ